MGRLKTSGTEKMDKRRKKNTIRRVSTSSTSSSVITSLSPSLTPVTTITPPSHKNEECEQCGNTMTLNALPKKQQNCQVCEYVVYCKSQRPCVHCKAIECDYFCEWCGKGYHTKCARLCNENVLNSDGFCCSTCEMEQGEDGGTKEDGNTAACGACELPFQTLHDSNTKENEESIGFKVNQSVLVENDEVLYNATITHVDTTLERIKIHFLRWSKSFDHWYDMDDERINESLACDCCNQWFHIGCLPLIKSSGRFKDTTYVCPDCLDAAKGFYTRTNVRIPAATKATKTITTSSSGVNRARKLSQVDEVHSTSPKGAIVKRRNGTKLVVVDSDSDDEVDISIRVEPTKKKDETKKTKEGIEKTSTDSIPNKPSSSKPSSLAAATNKKTIKGNKRKSSDLTDTKSTKKSLAVDDRNKIRTGKLSKKRNRSISLDEATTDDNHSSPEHTLSVDPLSPSHASLETAAAITPPKDNQKTQTFHRRVRSGHSVSSILNSPLSPFGGSSSPSMSVVQDVSRPQSAPLTGRSFESHLVKVEEDPFFLPSLSKKSKTSTASDNPSTTLSEKSSISRGSLSAFDILREVATQSMSDDLNSSGSSAEIAFSNGKMSVGNVNSYVDVYFEVRKEMYLRICQLEEERCLDSNTAQLLRSMIYPTSNRFHDLQFVYVVNKELPSWQLTKRLLELIPVTAGGTAPVVVPRMPIFNSTFSRPSIAICSSHTIGSNATTPQSRTGSMSTIVPPLLNRSTGHATSESVYETSSPLPSS